MAGALQAVILGKMIRQHRQPYGIYFLLCLATMALQICIANFHNSDNLHDMLLWQSGQNTAAFVAIVLVFSFTAVYSRQRYAKELVIALGSIFSVFILINFLMPYGIRFASQPDITPMHFPWGEQLNQLRGTSSRISNIVRLAYVVVYAWGFYCTHQLLKNGQRLTAALFGCGYLILLTAVFLSGLLETNRVDFIYVGGYGILAFNILMSVMVSRDFYEALNHMEYMLKHDLLTGLPNRTATMNELDRVNAASLVDTPYEYLLLLNVDRFDVINDTLGHATGNELLKQIAARLTEVIQSGDFAARLGGDEFVILKNDIELPFGILSYTESLQSFLSKPYEVQGHPVNVTFSIGIARHSQERSVDLLTAADLAIREAKKSSHSRIELYHDDFHEAINERLRIGNKLRHALLAGEFELYFQPQVNAVTRQIDCFEALIRWNSPDDGLIAPNRFIPVAEEMNLIIPIGKWVIEEACRKLVEFHEAGFPEIRMAINMAVQQLMQEHFTTEVAQVIEKYRLTPGQIELEITESAVMSEPEKCIRQLGLLKEIGIKLAVDDFGTGYSSLGYVNQLPVDVIKIDRTFVKDLTEGNQSNVICVTTIHMAKSLGLQTVAEGVETELQAEILGKMGCDILQGYYFSRPLPAAQALQLLTLYANK
ncbi:putative bifunctional diguanylate cyclase/phosphodiesterase [Leeia oryzae]|uniref:putative bifunctional diguanylate cyclase/phosphodiesterase n=1 Tax=Leeia oryzae TaxID=356662 RepID=UPI00036D8DC2|nr:bifunctional diguanylate cyclase/phosphodiesterase [Leeia oryzae]